MCEGTLHVLKYSQNHSCSFNRYFPALLNWRLKVLNSPQKPKRMHTANSKRMVVMFSTGNTLACTTAENLNILSELVISSLHCRKTALFNTVDVKEQPDSYPKQEKLTREMYSYMRREESHFESAEKGLFTDPLKCKMVQFPSLLLIGERNLV